MTDAIRLTIPHTKPYYGVARLVVGGLAARLDLSYDFLEDIQLALENLLDNDAYAAGPHVTVELIARPEAMEIAVGPLDGARVRRDLEGETANEGVGLRRLLAAVVQRVELERRDGDEWLRLEKDVAGAARP